MTAIHINIFRAIGPRTNQPLKLDKKITCNINALHRNHFSRQQNHSYFVS